MLTRLDSWGAVAEEKAATSINPSTGDILSCYPYHRKKEQDLILAAAAWGQSVWARTPVPQRAAVLARAGELLRKGSTKLARTITLEMGKPIAASRAEVIKCAALCEWYAEHAEQLLADETPDVGGDGEARVAYLPLGVVLAVMPWNFPLWQVLRAAVPILAAGNGVVLKHADNVQGSAYALAHLMQKAGLPDGAFGVLNITRAALPDVIADSRIAAVTVTAGVLAGSAIAAQAGRCLKKSVLELGGSDPFIVLSDANLERAVAAAIEARFQNNGQVCIAAKRIIVERPIADVFIERFVAQARALVQGDPLYEGTALGPMARERLRNELHEQVVRSIEQGAVPLLGGEMPRSQGYFYPATVLTSVTSDMAVAREETFGPVAAIMIAIDADDAVRIANESDYGLSGALWSNDVARARLLARQIQTGGIFINGVAASDPRVPIGGIKKSGYGRELSHFGIREFCNAQLVWERV